MSEHEEEMITEGAQATDVKIKVVHTTNLEYQTALNTMQQILDTARDGNFMVEAEGKSVTLVPAGDVQFEIDAREEGDAQSIAFKLKWPSHGEESVTVAGSREKGSEGETCVADQVRMNREAEEREYAELERRFESEFFGGCGCVEVPGPE